MITTEYVIGSDGRKGIVTRSENHDGGIFARPAEYKYLEGNCIMATWFRANADGSFSGRWADSKLFSGPITIQLI